MPVRDGTVLYVNVFRPPEDGRFPVVVSFDVYGKDSIHVAAAMPAGGRLYARPVQRLALRRVGGARSRLLGAERLCGGEGRGARHLGLQGPHLADVADGGRGLSRRHRMVRHAALEQRRGRDQRRVLSRHGAMAGRPAQPAASRGDDPVGGRQRPLPRMGVPRRHPGDELLPVPRFPHQEDLARLRARRAHGRRRRSIRSSTTTGRRATATSPTSRCRSTCAPAGRRRGCTIAARSRASGRPRRQHKWIEIHGRKEWETYFSREALERQLRFCDHFLKGVDNDWRDTPRVRYELRDRFYDGQHQVRRRVAAAGHALRAALSRCREPDPAARGAGPGGVAVLQLHGAQHGRTAARPSRTASTPTPS